MPLGGHDAPHAAMPTPPALLAFLGFTEFERRSFEAFFALGREQGPGYQLTAELERADCAVADADDDRAVACLVHAELLPRAVVLGSTPRAGAALQLPRPINLLLVMRALDTIVGARPRTSARLATADHTPSPRTALSGAAGAAAPRGPLGMAPAAQRTPTPPPAAAPSSAITPTRPERPDSNHMQRVLDELAFRTVTLPPHLDARAHAAQAAQATQATPARSGRGNSRRGEGGSGAPEHKPRQVATEPHSAHTRHDPTRSDLLPMEHILVIDQDAATLRLVAVQLQRFGFQMHLAGHPDDAMHMLTQRFHDYVFIDPALPGLDALLICRLAKQARPPDERPTTTVVLLADPNAGAAPLERALPAADACLRKPLDQRALLKVMGEREVARVAYADTARMTTLI